MVYNEISPVQDVPDPSVNIMEIGWRRNPLEPLEKERKSSGYGVQWIHLFCFFAWLWVKTKFAVFRPPYAARSLRRFVVTAAFVGAHHLRRTAPPGRGWGLENFGVQKKSEIHGKTMCKVFQLFDMNIEIGADSRAGSYRVDF